MNDVVYVSVKEVTDEHSARYIIPNKIYKGVRIPVVSAVCYALEGVIYQITGELAEVHTTLIGSTWLGYGDWDIRTKEEYLAQEEEQYLELIDRVAEIDLQAALYMRTEAIKLPEFCPAGNIASCFYWCSTPQGGKYWWNIEDKLESRK